MITYKLNTASKDELSRHIIQSNVDHMIEVRGETRQYAQKLVQYAMRFEAWDRNALVGLVAAYVNDLIKRESYITLLCVNPLYTNQKVASNLLTHVVDYVKKMNFVKINLKVNQNNKIALKLYQNFGFVPIKTVTPKIFMSKPINEK